MHNPPIRFARSIETKKIVHIDDVLNGISCNCKCVKCGEQFEAIQGKSNVWHFRHYQERECDGAWETAVHQAAKEILIFERSLKLGRTQYFDYQDAYAEYVVGDYRIDVVAMSGGRQTMIEIIVTCPLQDAKKRWLRDQQIDLMEIDLSKVSREVTMPELVQIVLHDYSNKKIYFGVSTWSSIVADWVSGVPKWVKWAAAIIGILAVFSLFNNRSHYDSE